MIQLASQTFDLSAFWTFGVLLSRQSGLFLALPGIGTDQWGPAFRFFPALLISISLTMSGIDIPRPETTEQVILVLGSEFALGFVIGSIPSFLLGGLGVAGQVIAGSIGLGQANMFDPSLGGSVAVIARVKMLLATVVFLAVDGHHVLLRAAAGASGNVGFGMFRPDMDTATILINELVNSFELAVSVSGPVLVTTLVTQFVLGLITKFVPQINVFIISLPLSLVVGLFLIAFTMPGLVEQVATYFTGLEETVGQIMVPPEAGMYVPEGSVGVEGVEGVVGPPAGGG